MLAVVARLLNSKFTVVGQAEDGFAALRAIKEVCPQLAILDISMPVMNGLELAKQLKKVQSSTKVVFLSLLVGEEFIFEARGCAHGYVVKMRLYSDLYAALYAALEGNFFTSDL